jgi:hypothetical protein
MAIGVIKNESTLGVMEEVTEGTYVPPVAGTDYLEVLSDGLEVNKTRELLERDNLSSTTETEAARVGMAEIVASVPLELRASATAGAAPQMLDLPLKSLLGGARTAVTDTTTTGNSSTVLEFGAAPPFAVGDSVIVKESGAYEVRPVSEVGATTITFPFALENGAPSDGVVVEAVATYYHDTANSKSLSFEHNVGNEIQQQADGCRAQAGVIENWSTGQIPTMSFTFGGLALARSNAGGTATPDFTADALPPVALEACLWIGGSKKSYNELSLNIENTLSFLTDACNADGKVASRITKQVVNFTANPYSDDTAITEWTAFEQNTDTSVFFYAANPSSTAGEFSEVVAVWIPQGKITEIPFGDNEGIVTDNLAVRAHQSTSNDSIFISFS